MEYVAIGQILVSPGTPGTRKILCQESAANLVAMAISSWLMAALTASELAVEW